MEAGLDSERVADWLLGTSLPTDAECERLAAYFKAAVDEVKDRRNPSRRR